jgi:hypothetical protein
MSRGLGTRQKLFLTALRELERQHGPGLFRTSAIAERMFADSLPLTDRALAIDATRQARLEAVQRDAYAGDEEAIALMGLCAAIGAHRRRQTRINSLRGPARHAGDLLNPARIAAGLARRGLLKRQHGAAGLTAAGRELVAPASS